METIPQTVVSSGSPNDARRRALMRDEARENDLARYHAAQHAMQTGVGMEVQAGSHQAESKHLRVGVNTAQCDHAALIRLLIAKGVILEDEYITAIADEMEREAQRYTQRVRQQYSTSGVELA